MTDKDTFGTWLASLIGALPTVSINLDTLLSAFIGTFVGAYVAFGLEHKAREMKQLGKRGTEGNLAPLPKPECSVASAPAEDSTSAPTSGTREWPDPLAHPIPQGVLDADRVACLALRKDKASSRHLRLVGGTAAAGQDELLRC